MSARSWLLRCYPSAWRDKYGDDLSAYLDDAFGDDLPLRASVSLGVGGLRERVRSLTPRQAGTALAALLVASGIYLIVDGTSTYTAMMLNGAVWPVSGHDPQIRTFQAGHSTGQIVVGALIITLALATPFVSPSRKAMASLIATAVATLSVGMCAIISGNHTYWVTRSPTGVLQPLPRGPSQDKIVEGARLVGADPYTTGRSAPLIAVGAVLLLVSAGALFFAWSARSRPGNAR